MILQDLHTHTTYCDGKNTPEEMVKAAIEKGLVRIGFSGHCYTFFDEKYCMSIPNVARYIAEINSLKLNTKDKLKYFAELSRTIIPIFQESDLII